jgi:hypothetical protein
VVQRPTGSTAILSNASARDPMFTPDQVGVYELRLDASDGTLQSVTTVLTDAVCYTSAAVSGGGRSPGPTESSRAESPLLRRLVKSRPRRPRPTP